MKVRLNKKNALRKLSQRMLKISNHKHKRIFWTYILGDK